METQEIIKRLDAPNGRYYQGEVDNAVIWTHPSVTTILSAVYPSGYYLEKWIRDNGEHGRIEFEKSADQGTEVHVAIEALLQGREVPVYEDMPNKVKKGIQAFIDWYNAVNPKILATEHIVHGNDYAGACDLICEIDGEIWVVDFKTSRSLHDQHRVQVSAYAHAQQFTDDPKVALLQLGNSTKKGYTWSEVDYVKYLTQWKHFLQTYKMLFPDSKPQIKEYPEFLIIPNLVKNEN